MNKQQTSTNNGLPNPQYAIGQVVWLATTQSGKEPYQCPDCLGTKQWKVITPAGEEYDYPCARCNGTGTLSQLAFEPAVQRLTIGSVRLDTNAKDAEKISYMCKETGVGSGSFYYEPRLFWSEEAAQEKAAILAADQTANLDTGDQKPRRDTFRELSTYKFRDAAIKEAEDKVWNYRHKWQRLIERVCELSICPVATWDDDVRSCSLSDEQRNIVQESIVYLHEEAADYLRTYRREADE